MTSYLKDLVDAVAQAKCEELPSEFDPKSMSFGKAPAVEAVLKEKSVKLLDGLKAAGANNGFDLVCSGEPALFYMRIANDDSMMLHQEWIAECVKRGIFFSSHHNHFMNYAVSDADIKHTIEVADEAFKIVKKAHPEAF